MNTAELFFLAAVTALVVSMPVFSLLTRTRPMDANVAARSQTILLSRWIRDWLVWVIAPLENVLVRRRVSPTFLNVLGAAMGLSAGVLFSRNSPFAAGILVLIGGLADVLDGRVARARNIQSEYGAFLDSTLDRFSESFTFIGLILYFVPNTLALAAVGLALSSSLLVSYTRARGEALGVNNASGVMQRAERLVLLAIGAICEPLISRTFGLQSGSFLAVVVGVIAVGSFATAIYRTAAIAAELRRKASPSTIRSPNL